MNERFVLQGNLAVLDTETGLVWQRAASEDRMVWKDGFAYVDKLNETEFAGDSSWRYPSKDELQTLILPEEHRQTGLYIHPLFGSQRNCWTSTSAEHHRACYVDFYYGDVYVIEENYANHFVRAVRTK
ncbi:MAG: DUF1566 domain-containing protein [Desulforhabdus sp.]|jgi:serine/threonine-protein kinase|nr:DUF1566 domain-containing protein [Desulforhabdus sp.]